MFDAVSVRIQQLISRVEADRISTDLSHLSDAPIPCRTLNYTLPGHTRCTLYEADDYVAARLTDLGYSLERQTVPVQAFVPDSSTPWGFRKPLETEPWYDAVNLLAVKRGASKPNEWVLFVAHKDSQSWLDVGPGAHDNAIGVCSLLEIARVLAGQQFTRSIGFLFCNEEHWPWTSVAAAKRLADANMDIACVLNVDSIAGKSEAMHGRFPGCIRYTTDEGERVAKLAHGLNGAFGIGLEHSIHRAEVPNDDDGSFVNAGIPPAVLFIGSYPYADPNYHTVNDKPQLVDVENARRATQLVVATAVWVSENGIAE